MSYFNRYNNLYLTRRTAHKSYYKIAMKKYVQKKYFTQNNLATDYKHQ